MAQALATPGLGWLMLTIAAAGIVRGFTGFGTALIFVPVAGQFLEPHVVILVITLTGVASSSALLPNAWSSADHSEVGMMAAAAIITVPVGFWLLDQIDALTVRWIVACIATVTLVAIVSGWQWRGRLGPAGRGGVGGAAGLMGGMTGLTGPVVIMFYLANARSASNVRANTILFLAALDVVVIAFLVIGGHVSATLIWLGALLSVPYFCTSLVGQRLFDPFYEQLYRRAAYTVIGCAVLSGLPLFD